MGCFVLGFHCTPKRRCLWRREMTWWPQEPSRSRCLQLTFWWFCATPWPAQNLWSSRSSCQCRHSQSFQVTKLKRDGKSYTLQKTRGSFNFKKNCWKCVNNGRVFNRRVKEKRGYTEKGLRKDKHESKGTIVDSQQGQQRYAGHLLL